MGSSRHSTRRKERCRPGFARRRDGRERYLSLVIWDQIPAGVVEHRSGDRTHVDRVLGEADPAGAQPRDDGPH
jgi:hypothetical protein